MSGGGGRGREGQAWYQKFSFLPPSLQLPYPLHCILHDLLRSPTLSYCLLFTLQCALIRRLPSVDEATAEVIEKAQRPHM